jgi:uncharacterized protein
MQTNVFGEELIACSVKPLTGFYRNGCCETGEDDPGVHSVCVITTESFLEFSKSAGNDLSSPKPEWGFPGLVAGDRWCLCASRWVEAWRAGVAPAVILEATNEKTLELIPIEELIKFAYRSFKEENKR